MHLIRVNINNREEDEEKGTVTRISISCERLLS